VQNADECTVMIVFSVGCGDGSGDAVTAAARIDAMENGCMPTSTPRDANGSNYQWQRGNQYHCDASKHSLSGGN
jgi:hypothetical protein